MMKTTTILATAAAALVLTSCGGDAETVAEIGCEDLVKEHLGSPEDLSFEHADAEQDGDRWTIEGTATWGASGESANGDYMCRITVDGQDWTGRVSMAAP
jgi:hypothetical protein